VINSFTSVFLERISVAIIWIKGCCSVTLNPKSLGQPKEYIVASDNAIQSGKDKIITKWFCHDTLY